MPQSEQTVVEVCCAGGSQRFLAGSCVLLKSFLCLQLSQRQPCSEDETMVPVLTSRKASELPVNEVACLLQVTHLATNARS